MCARRRTYFFRSQKVGKRHAPQPTALRASPFAAQPSGVRANSLRSDKREPFSAWLGCKRPWSGTGRGEVDLSVVLVDLAGLEFMRRSPAAACCFSETRKNP